jgi:hypothetical protein
MYMITISVLNVFSYESLYNYILLVLSISIARGVPFMRQTYRICHPIYLANQSFPCSDNVLNFDLLKDRYMKVNHRDIRVYVNLKYVRIC